MNMTIPAGNIYCPSCQEACHDHPTICTVCGTTLTSPPEVTQQRRAVSQYSVVPEDLVEDIRQNARHLSNLLRHVQRSVIDTRHAQQDLMESLHILRGEIQQTPITATPSPNLRATAEKTLEQLPRITLENTLFLHPSTIELRNAERVVLRLEAVPGEFGTAQPCCIEDAALILSEPKTAKGDFLSADTQQAVQSQPSVLYLERGDGVTFARKALLAQRAGAKAVIIGNNLAEPWPYVMRDSKKEAEQENLTIPVVMVKQADARALLDACSQSPLRCQFKIQKQAKECVICTEDFQISQTILRLPECGHVFHESCALLWLKAHNTCPYCRRELPTDDQAYEEERRRTQRTHAGSEGVSDSRRSWNEMYG